MRTGNGDSGDGWLAAAEVLAPTTLGVIRAISPGDVEVLMTRLRRHGDVLDVLVPVDPVVQRELADSADRWAEGAEVVTALRVTEDTACDVTRRSTTAGYLWGRLLTHTADQPLRWSQDVDPARLAATVESIDFAGIGCVGDYAVTLGQLNQVLNAIMADAGHPDDDHLLNMASMAFDSAVAVALVEHNLCASARGDWP